MSIRWLSHLTGLTPLAAGMIITTVTGLTAMIGVWVLVRHYADRQAADRATLLVALFPGTFVLSLVYSEGFAITFLAFGLLALLQRRWLLAGLLGLVASATTPVALAFEVSCLWCAYRGSSDRSGLAVPGRAGPGPAGLRGLPAVALAAHRPPERLAADRAGRMEELPVARLRRPHRGGLRPGPDRHQPDRRPAVRRHRRRRVRLRSWPSGPRMPRPVLLYGLAAAVLGMISAPIGLRPRFIFLAFPLIIAVGTWLRGRAYVTVLAGVRGRCWSS